MLLFAADCCQQGYHDEAFKPKPLGKVDIGLSEDDRSTAPYYLSTYDIGIQEIPYYSTFYSALHESTNSHGADLRMAQQMCFGARITNNAHARD